MLKKARLALPIHSNQVPSLLMQMSTQPNANAAMLMENKIHSKKRKIHSKKREIHSKGKPDFFLFLILKLLVDYAIWSKGMNIDSHLKDTWIWTTFEIPRNWVISHICQFFFWVWSGFNPQTETEILAAFSFFICQIRSTWPHCHIATLPHCQILSTWPHSTIPPSSQLIGHWTKYIIPLAW